MADIIDDPVIDFSSEDEADKKKKKTKRTSKKSKKKAEANGKK